MSTDFQNPRASARGAVKLNELIINVFDKERFH